MSPAQLESDFAKMTDRKERFWLFLNRTFDSDPHVLMRAFCEKQYRRERYASWNGVELMLYRLPRHTAGSSTDSARVLEL